VADGLTLTVLGASGSYAGPGQACSGYLLTAGPTRVWLDAGSGTLANLQRHIALADLDAIVLSHEHPDHWTDVQGFAVASHYVLQLPPIPVFAPKGLRGHLLAPADALVWHEVADGAGVEIGALRLTFRRTDHGPETLAVRVDGAGRSLGYSADTGPGWSLTALGPGLNLALCEATYLEELPDGARHMTARQAGEMGREAGADALVITHLQPTVDPAAARAAAAAAFGAPVEAAVAGLVRAV
jgi:ribonuclease BN (tRNA processing enzyme)